MLYLDHNTYWGRWWAKAPRSKMVSGSWSLVEPQRCQCLCVTPRQSSGSPPQHRQARQTNLRYFRENKPKKAKENTFQTSRAKFCLYRENQSMSDPLPSPHPHTGAASWNPQYLAVRLSWCRPRALKWAWSSGGTWEAAGLSSHPHPMLVHLQAQMWPFLGREDCIWKEQNCSGSWGDAKCTVSLWTNPSTS